jgi:hypothetical protein
LDLPEIALLARYPGWVPSSSHFFPLFNTIGTALRVVNNAAQLTVVVQGLRGNLVAQTGRKVADSALVKSAAYEYFLDEHSKTSRKLATGGRLNEIDTILRNQPSLRL